MKQHDSTDISDWGEPQSIGGGCAHFCWALKRKLEKNGRKVFELVNT